MLKKNQPLKLLKPGSMQMVREAIEQGHNYRREIVKATKLKEGQVTSALNNLVYVGMVVLKKDDFGRSVYLLPGQWAGGVSEGFKGVAWVFGHRFTTSDNGGSVSK